MPITRDEAAVRAADLEQVSYAVHLDLVDPLQFESSVTVCFRSRSGRTFLELAGAHHVTVVVDDQASDQSVYDGARVELTGLTPGEQHEVRVTASLPYVTDGEGMHTFTDPVDGERYVGAYLGVDLTQRVFASFDQPDVKATVSLTVRSEPGSTVLANGQLLHHDPDHDVWQFATTQPLPCNQFVVCAGRWVSSTWEHKGRQFGWHARQSLSADLEREADELRRVTTSCFAHYQALFATPYSFGSYHQIFVPGQNWGAQETPGCVMYADELLSDALDDPAREERAVIIAHEMSHMWFGNLATMRWYQDIWLNEAFADYLGYRVASEAAGYSGARVGFEVSRKPYGYRADGRRSSHPVAATADDVPDSAAAASNFDAISYNKGHAVIRQLATWLGDERFFAGVNAYLGDFAFGNAGLDDFVEHLAVASPGLDVVGWATSWLSTTGFDRIDIVNTDDGPALRRVGSRRHRISVAAYDDSLALVEVQQLEVGDNTVALPGWQGHLILPNARGETFARAQPRQDDDVTLRRGVSRVKDPLHRAQVWANTFAALHAGELGPMEFFETVESQLPTETNPFIVEAVIGQTLGRGAQVCRSAAEVRRGFVAVAVACAVRLGRSADQADATTGAFVDGLVRCSGAAADLQRWNEEGTLFGVRLSLEQGWTLLWRLAELGVVTFEELGSNLSPPATAQVADWAERARAALPSEQSQRAAWSSVGDERVSNRRTGALLDGLWSPGRGSLPPAQVMTYLQQGPSLAMRRGAGFAALLGAHHPGLALSPHQQSTLSQALDGELEPRLRRHWQDWFDDLSLRR